MARIEIPDGDRPEQVRLWQVSPELGRTVRKVASAIPLHSRLSLREQEAARIRIAQINDCGY